MHQYLVEKGNFETEEQHLACQVGSILKTKNSSEVETEVLIQKVKIPQEVTATGLEPTTA